MGLYETEGWPKQSLEKQMSRRLISTRSLQDGATPTFGPCHYQQAAYSGFVSDPCNCSQGNRPLSYSTAWLTDGVLSSSMLA
jgi:hypothetical protein